MKINTLSTKPDAVRCAAAFGCTVEQAKRMFAKNAEGLRTMAERAEQRNGKYNGYAAHELRRHESSYRAASL